MKKNKVLRVLTLKNGSAWISVNDAGRVPGLDDINTQIDFFSFEVREFPFRVKGKIRRIQFISELNFYTLISKSTKETVEPYNEWLMNEIIPLLIKKGVYILSTQNSPFEIKRVRQPFTESPSPDRSKGGRLKQ